MQQIDIPTIEEIWNSIEKVQNNCRTNLITRKQFDDAMRYTEALPFGLLYIRGMYTKYGKSLSRQTVAEIGWYTRKHAKHFQWYVSRYNMLMDDLEDLNDITLKTNKASAMRYVFPERYQKLRHIKDMRLFRDMRCQLPPDNVRRVLTADYGMILAIDSDYRVYLCSPLGVKFVTHYTCSSIKTAARVLGMELPKEHTWEKMQPYWVLNAIK